VIGPPELLAELTADAESGTPIAAMKQRWFALAAGSRFGGRGGSGENDRNDGPCFCPCRLLRLLRPLGAGCVSG